MAFKGCNSEILKDGIGLFLISLINASGLVSIMWIISNTWGNFRYDKIYLTASGGPFYKTSLNINNIHNIIAKYFTQI